MCPDITENRASHVHFLCLSPTVLHSAVRCTEHVNFLIIPSNLPSLMFCNY